MVVVREQVPRQSCVRHLDMELLINPATTKHNYCTRLPRRRKLVETIESRTIKVIEHLHTVPRGNIPVYQVLLVQELKSLKGLQGDSDQVLSAQWVGQAAIQRALTLQQPPVDKKFSSLIPG